MISISIWSWNLKKKKFVCENSWQFGLNCLNLFFFYLYSISLSDIQILFLFVFLFVSRSCGWRTTGKWFDGWAHYIANGSLSLTYTIHLSVKRILFGIKQNKTIEWNQTKQKTCFHQLITELRIREIFFFRFHSVINNQMIQWNYFERWTYSKLRSTNFESEINKIQIIENLYHIFHLLFLDAKVILTVNKTKQKKNKKKIKTHHQVLRTIIIRMPKLCVWYYLVSSKRMFIGDYYTECSEKTCFDSQLVSYIIQT